VVASIDHDHSVNSATPIGTIKPQPNAAIRPFNRRHSHKRR